MRHNYLNNRDLLKEIHLSKMTYSSYRDREKDNMYDIILNSIKEINETSIQKAKQNRMARILQETGNTIEISSISTQDLIFRVMTWEHIPLLEKKEEAKKLNVDTFFTRIEKDKPEEEDEIDFIFLNKKEKAKHVKINFPPFEHYRLDENEKPFVVAKSHWQGDLNTGKFCCTHGYFTDNFAQMLMKLVEKYALRGNWRNYSYRDEMEGQAIMQLCQVALQFDESKSLNPFAYLTQVGYCSFLRILGIEKRHQKIRDDLLIQQNHTPSYTRTNDDTSFGEN
ncbi:Uncharacterised protein [uncultured archaeon]|nr:Uncharacterised protein [uncultured archaeon]